MVFSAHARHSSNHAQPRTGASGSIGSPRVARENHAIYSLGSPSSACDCARSPYRRPRRSWPYRVGHRVELGDNGKQQLANGRPGANQRGQVPCTKFRRQNANAWASGSRRTTCIGPTPDSGRDLRNHRARREA